MCTTEKQNPCVQKLTYIRFYTFILSLLILYFKIYFVLLIFMTFFVKDEISYLVLVEKILLKVLEEIKPDDG